MYDRKISGLYSSKREVPNNFNIETQKNLKSTMDTEEREQRYLDSYEQKSRVLLQNISRSFKE